MKAMRAKSGLSRRKSLLLQLTRYSRLFNLDVCLRVATLNSLYHFSLLVTFRSFWQLFASFIRRIGFLIVAAYQTRAWWRFSISSSLSRDQSWSQRSDSCQYYDFGTNLGWGSELTGHTLCMRQHQCVVFTRSSAVNYVVMNVVLYRGHISTTVSQGLGTEKSKTWSRRCNMGWVKLARRTRPGLKPEVLYWN